MMLGYANITLELKMDINIFLYLVILKRMHDWEPVSNLPMKVWPEKSI